MLRSLPILAVLGLALLTAGAARAETPVGAQHAAWKSCLHDSFALQAALSGRSVAADTALRDCRAAETTYLSALSASPLVDDEDVSRVRPALLARARGWLLGGEQNRQL